MYFEQRSAERVNDRYTRDVFGPSIPAGSVRGYRMQFRSFNFPDHFIRHRNFLGEISRKDAGGPADDFNFVVVDRGQGRVSLRSVNFRDRFLRHRDFVIRLEGPKDPRPDAFKLDSVFVREPGLANRSGFSFRSVNFPDRYIRHRDFRLLLEPRNSPNLAPDATFFESVPLSEPEGIPADG